jgi:hypothetical protein
LGDVHGGPCVKGAGCLKGKYDIEQ